MEHFRSQITAFLLLLAPLFTYSYPWLHNQDPSNLLHDNVQVHLLEESYQPSYDHHFSRHERSADDMPSNVHFRFNMGTREVELRLKRSTVGLNKDGKKDVGGFPVFVIENGQIIRKQLQHDAGVGLYANESTGSSFVVRKTSNRSDFILEGLFYDGIDRLHLTRDPAGRLHSIHKQARVVDFSNDYINTVNNEVSKTGAGGETQSPNIRKGRPRLKRQILGGSEHEIQLFMVADNKDYRTWLKYYGYNSTLTELEMNLYYAFIANSMSVRYSSVSLVDPSFSLDIIITGLLIVNSQEISYWTEFYTLRPGSHYVNASTALESFRHWVKLARFDLPPSDHWMLFTGFDIFTDRNPNVAGLAKLGGMCSLSSISIIEQDNTGSVGATAAHELGHSLSALHDGEEKECFDEDNYIMSRKLKTPDDELLASRPWQFSPCSVRAFKMFVSEFKCTQKSVRGMSVLSTSLSPGQVFSADLQCQLALGNGSYFGRGLQVKEGYPSMCRRMFCAVPDEPGLYQAIFAMEKTSCGDGKWCQRGKCVEHHDAPRMEDNCPQGDDPTAPCVREDCPYYTNRTKVVYCCNTCRVTPPPWLGYLASKASETHVIRRKPRQSLLVPLLQHLIPLENLLQQQPQHQLTVRPRTPIAQKQRPVLHQHWILAPRQQPNKPQNYQHQLISPHYTHNTQLEQILQSQLNLRRQYRSQLRQSVTSKQPQVTDVQVRLHPSLPKSQITQPNEAYRLLRRVQQLFYQNLMRQIHQHQQQQKLGQVQQQQQPQQHTHTQHNTTPLPSARTQLQQATSTAPPTHHEQQQKLPQQPRVHLSQHVVLSSQPQLQQSQRPRIAPLQDKKGERIQIQL